jgi:hypothetical protein
MKKLFYLAGAMLLAGAVMTTSCSKDDDSGSTLTKEQREEEKQKQEEEQQKQKEEIKANKVIEYTCDITASETSYDGTKFDVDVKAIADELGVTVDEFILGIEGKEGGATDITTYYIQGSTGDELIGANTQVGASDKGWGHWLNKDSDVTTWGEGQAADYSITYAGQAVIWTSLHRADENSTDFVCEVGQYPAKLAEADLIGKTFTIKEGVKFDDIKVVLKITVNIKGLEALTAEVVDSKELTLTTSVYDSHEDYIELDSTEILSKIGATSFADCKFVALKADGSYAQEADDPSLGLYWENVNGEASGYGDGNFYIGYNRTPDDENCGKLVIGQYGRKLQVPEAEGSETKVDFTGDFTAKWGVYCNGKVVMVNVKVTIASYEDPEAGTFTGTPANSTKDYTIEKEYTNDYAAVKVDVKEQLETSFQKSCYELYQAFQAGTLKFYASEVTEADPEYTANKPGYWLSAEGKGVAYAEGVVYAELTLADYANQNIVFNIGNHPDNCKAGATVPLKIFATDGTTTAVMNITITVGAAPAE